jgi:anti-anti-sigma factor
MAVDVGSGSVEALYQPLGAMELEQGAGGPVLHLRGDVDAPVVQGWEAEEPVDQSSIAAVDVSEMAYIDSIGLTFLVRWAQARAAADQPAVIRNAGPRFEQILHLTGIGSMFVREG